MEDVNGNADTTQPAKNAACSPCPVSRRLHALLR